MLFFLDRCLNLTEILTRSMGWATTVLIVISLLDFICALITQLVVVHWKSEVIPDKVTLSFVQVYDIADKLPNVRIVTVLSNYIVEPFSILLALILILVGCGTLCEKNVRGQRMTNYKFQICQCCSWRILIIPLNI